MRNPGQTLIFETRSHTDVLKTVSDQIKHDLDDQTQFEPWYGPISNTMVSTSACAQ